MHTGQLYQSECWLFSPHLLRPNVCLCITCMSSSDQLVPSRDDYTCVQLLSFCPPSISSVASASVLFSSSSYEEPSTCRSTSSPVFHLLASRRLDLPSSLSASQLFVVNKYLLTVLLLVLYVSVSHHGHLKTKKPKPLSFCLEIYRSVSRVSFPLTQSF